MSFGPSHGLRIPNARRRGLRSPAGLPAPGVPRSSCALVSFTLASRPQLALHGAQERVGVMPDEVSGIYFRSSRPLPKDADFVSGFRRPLHAEAKGLQEDTDLQAIKAKTEASEPEELGDLIFPSLPGAGAPAPTRRKAPAPRGTGLPLGRAKQARLRDDLSDLLKPGKGLFDSHRKPGAPASAAHAMRERLGQVSESQSDPWKAPSPLN